MIRYLEEAGYKYDEELTNMEIKRIISVELENSKRGREVNRYQMNIVRTNLERADHNDMVNIDQILTRIKNEKETEYQWGSLILGRKWKLF